jgi:hypothetical protein
MPTRRPSRPRLPTARRKPSAAHLRELIDQATIDCYNDSETATGFLTMIEEHLRMLFATEVLGVEVTVAGVDITPRDEVVAVCKRGRERQTIPILDLKLLSPRPPGSEWIDAYRAWLTDS